MKRDMEVMKSKRSPQHFGMDLLPFTRLWYPNLGYDLPILSIRPYFEHATP